MDARLVGLVVVIGLLVGSLPVGIAVATASGPSHPSSTLETDRGASMQPAVQTPAATHAAWPDSSISDTLEYRTELRQLPDQPGEFEAEFQFAIPESVTKLEIDLESGATVEGADGFEETDDGRYRWTETSESPTIRTTLSANRSADGGHHAPAHTHAHDVGADSAGDETGYAFLETGEWGVVQVPHLGLSFQRTEPVGLEKSAVVDGPGATGGDIAFFGPVTEHERSTAGETIRLAVPEAATLDEDPADVLEALTGGSETLEIGARNDETFMVAVPADADFGPEGVQYGQADAWVSADASLSEPGSVWFHEYVHTRQEYANSADGTTAETAWLIEGQAEYEAARLGLETGLLEFDAFSRFLAGGERSPYADGVLADQTTWTDDRTDYVKGRLVYGDLDRQIRTATDGDRSIESVFQRLNAADGPVTGATFLESLEAVGGEDVRATAERYTKTAETPDMWDTAAHEAAFGHSSTDMTVGLEPETTSITAGDYEWPFLESHSSESAGEPAVLAVPADEPLTIPVAVANDGDAAGTYDVALQADGKTVAYEHDRLAAGETATETLSWTPPTPGEYTLRVGDEQVPVVVRAPSSVAVTDLSLESEPLEAGESVTATATVEATDDRPGATLVPFRTASATDKQPVSVPAGGVTTVEHEFMFDEDGQYEVAAGEKSAMVTVGHNAPAELESVPGFTGPAVLVAAALVGGVLLLRLRRHSV